MNGESKLEAVRERLERLARSGRLTPAEVVIDARDEESPLHSYFEWDDRKAASRFRVFQARRLIASVQVLIVEETRVISTVAYVRDPSAEPREQGYVRTVSLIDDKERARQTMVNELGRLNAYVTRVQSLAAVLGLEEQAADLATVVANIANSVGAAR